MMAQVDLEELMNFLIPSAQQFLAKSGEFYPFAASMTADGAIQANMSGTGEEYPKSDDLISILTAAFRQEAVQGKLKATGICYDVRVVLEGAKEKTDAICVWLEHVDGDAVNILLPYRRRSTGKIEYDELRMTSADREVFRPIGGAR
jgi:hypothetical protein